MVEPNSQAWRKRSSDEAAAPAAEPEHVHYEILLERHLDGELTLAERQELFAHIEICEECREILEAEETLVDHLSRIPRLMPPSDLRAKILEEASREREILMQGGILLGDPEQDQEAPLPRRVVASPVRLWATRIFVVLSALLFLLTADVSSVPVVNILQHQLREGVLYLLTNAREFLLSPKTDHSRPLSTNNPNHE